MQCLGECFKAFAPSRADLPFVQDSEQAGVDAACKLMANFTRVVQDITNPGPNNIDGKKLTQTELKRIDPQHLPCVRAMVSAVGCRLLRKGTSGASTPEEALVWAQAARFLGARLQGSPEECCGRKADMSAAQAAAMRTALGQIEAAHMLMYNRETVVLDITNPGPRGVKGGQLSQTGLRRVDRKHQASVDAMINEVICRLLGKSSRMKTAAELSEPSGKEEVLVWAEAAAFFGARIQGSSDECEGRKADMSMRAATALRTVLAEMEAAHTLMSNRERVVQDICNPGPNNIDGKKLTQTELKRLDVKYRATVDAMIREVINSLLGKTMSKPLTPEEAQVWAQAATYFSGRIQGTPGEMPGRNPDMSLAAATALRTMLAQVGA